MSRDPATLDLFTTPDTRVGPPVELYERAMGDTDADDFAALRAKIPWRFGEAVMYGKRVKVPRGEAWFGDRPYRYGGQVQHPQPWPKRLLAIKAGVEEITEERFDACFANLYRTGHDCIAWHADDDAWIGPVVASLSFGASRTFVLRRKADHKDKYRAELGGGDLFVMRAGCQEHWEHSLRRTKRQVGERINLTFRQTVRDA